VRLALLAVLALPASVHAVTVSPDTRETGWSGLRVRGGRPDDVVTTKEGGGLVARLQLDRSGAATGPRLLARRCHRSGRRVAASDTASKRAAAKVTTPRCERRLELAADPPRPHAGHAMIVWLRDRWGLGDLPVQLCLNAPIHAHRCHTVTVGRWPTPVVLHAPRPGRWTIVAKGAQLEVSHALVIRPHDRRLSILAAGDSMIENPAASLVAAQRGFVVQRDVEPGTGISKPVTDWRHEAARWTARHKPDVIVFFVGWNEGYPFGTTLCCGSAWVDEWARRARQIMTTYSRGGAAQVYWLTLPAFRKSRPIVLAVNQALAQAVQGMDSGTRLLDMGAIFTPGLVYRDAMPVNGKTTVVRQSDGIHLNHAGALIAAHAILRALHKDEILRR
jgi:lysophospholipase L1-like esterase